MLGMLGVLATPTGSAQAADTGPRLTVTAAKAARALSCTGPIRPGARPPVLFLHGTTSNPTADWSWNWVRVFDARGWGHCELTLPDSGNADIQIAAEYVVRAIRTMSARAGQRIDVVGHSQGGMIVRWALRFWPDTRADVDDVVGLASSNHGTAVFDAQCTLGVCSAANWQQRRGSAFLAALNTGPETFPGISYTQISTTFDEVVVPSTSAWLKAPAGDPMVLNTSVQAVCPLEVVDHFGMSYSNGAWLIGLDALTHRGPASLARISRATCARLLMPGVDPVTFPVHAALALAQTARSSLVTPQLRAEPALRAYALRAYAR